MRKLFLVVLLSTLFFTGCTQMIIMAMNQSDITEFKVEKDNLYLLGYLNSQTLGQFKSVYRNHPDIKTVVLTASAGSLDDETTFKLGRYIRSKGLNTHLLSNSAISSGAVDLFVSGVKRTIEKGTKIGVHSWSDGDKEAREFPKDSKEHRLNADYIKDMMGDEKFYWFTIYAAGSDDIYWLSEDEVRELKLFTNGDFLEPSGDETPFKKKFLDERKSVLED